MVFDGGGIIGVGGVDFGVESADPYHFFIFIGYGDPSSAFSKLNASEP
jgi:hypothetical protein